jgi:hypothetical protein
LLQHLAKSWRVGHVLGDVTPEEKLQVEMMASKHQAIKAELNELERSMELFAEDNAVEPPAHLRDRVLNSVLTNFGDDALLIQTQNS